MDSDVTNQILNRLRIIHQYSLANYVADARPWWNDEGGQAARVLRDVVSQQRQLADRFGRLLVEQSGEVTPGAFPGRFAALHDLASGFMWAELIRYQQRTIASIEKAIAQLPPGTLARAVAQESLGVARAHLDAMREVDAVATPRAE
jgi:hypothetical protein